MTALNKENVSNYGRISIIIIAIVFLMVSTTIADLHGYKVKVFVNRTDKLNQATYTPTHCQDQYFLCLRCKL